MYYFIERNFKLSVLLLFIFSILYFITLVNSVDQIAATPGRSILKTFLSASALVIITGVSWFTSYRHGHGQGVAFLIGFILLISVIGHYISAQVNDFNYSKLLLGLILYLSLSHILYALKDIEDIILGKR